MANVRKNPFHPGFKGVWIPAGFLKLGLKPIEADVLSYIFSFEAVKANPKEKKKARPKKPCFASNAYLADLFNVGESTIARAIANLKALDYIRVENPNPRRHLLSIYEYGIGIWLHRGRKAAKQRYVKMTQKRNKKRL